MKRNLSKISTNFLLALLISALAACSKDSPEPSPVTPVVKTDAIGLHTLAEFPIGVAISTDKLYTNTAYEAVANKQFNSVTAENIFKPSYLHPSEGTYNWTDADKLAKYCQDNGKRLHGHTLVWHSQIPKWMEDYVGTPEQWDAMMKTHIQTIVAHFKGKAVSWDVVNEAFNDDGTFRNSVWYQHLGEDFIEKAFVYAHEADPDAILFYNDYNIESSPSKRNAILELLVKLKDKGVAVGGIGMQMHIGLSYPSLSDISTATSAFYLKGFRVHWSELDVSTNPDANTSYTYSTAVNAALTSRMAGVVKRYFEVPASLRWGITFWGVGDGDSWIPIVFKHADNPLLYDAQYKPKDCYYSVQTALKDYFKTK
ncbi:MAG: hypothetical protein RIS47_1368 [Bacteroidota bacterium]|jgi:endo-1,4-beta-xylanase